MPNMKDLMAANPDTLAEAQLTAMKKHAIAILKDIICDIEAECFRHVIARVNDTHFIDFRWEGADAMDLGEYCTKMVELLNAAGRGHHDGN